MQCHPIIRKMLQEKKLKHPFSLEWRLNVGADLKRVRPVAGGSV